MTIKRSLMIFSGCFAMLLSAQADDLLTQNPGEPFTGSLESRPFFLRYGSIGKFSKEDQPDVSSRRPRGAGAEVYAKAAPAIVLLDSDISQGTGFFISNNGWIITNHHVVDGCRYVPGKGNVMNVTRGRLGPEGWMEEPYEAGLAVVYKISEQHDLALLKILSSDDNLPFLDLATALPGPGDDCVAIGHPGIGAMWTVRTGQVTGLYTADKRSEHVVKFMKLTAAERAKLDLPEYYQTNLDIHHGDSGGPLLDARGNVIGVTVAIRDDSGTSLSIHIHHSELKEFLEKKPTKPLVLAPRSIDMDGFAVEERDFDDDGNIDAVVGRLPDNGQILSLVLTLSEFTASNKGVNKVSTEDESVFIPHFSMYALPKLTIAFDSDLDGTFDSVFRDEDSDAEFDTVFRLSGSGWTAEKFDGDPLKESSFQAVEVQKAFSGWPDSLQKILVGWKEIIRSRK